MRPNWGWIYRFGAVGVEVSERLSTWVFLKTLALVRGQSHLDGLAVSGVNYFFHL